MSYPLRISPEVQQALDHRRPVVALESTLITHGLPHPTNVETALAMEAAVRKSGAIPATVAILDGIIIVGISEAQIRQLAAMPAGTVRKCSRRDLPIAIALRQHGATTVAGTMIVAHMVGIRVFATGGIGGVHRGLPQDISADLIELGRTAVTVVSSGAKSILDLPLTLEVLETQGVPVIGYQTEELPAFYALKSGLPVDQSVQCAEEVARIMESSRAIGARHGMLVTVPIPADSALDADLRQRRYRTSDSRGGSGRRFGEGHHTLCAKPREPVDSRQIIGGQRRAVGQQCQSCRGDCQRVRQAVAYICSLSQRCNMKSCSNVSAPN